MVRSWIIPAYAGSTASSHFAESTCWDHPRIRGEHFQCRAEGVYGVGSSPHTRGARPRPLGPPEPGRIIPAYAGSTRRSSFPCPFGGDHPRIRGEHGGPPASAGGPFGSSPHTRGARRAAPSAREFHGIIPAYAGSTRTVPVRVRSIRDHPRIRGEHSSDHAERSLHCGSSPHTRGARAGVLRLFLGEWIIPAYAGSTRAGRARKVRCPDHPRIRGEHSPAHVLAFRQAGSSPHTRGAPGRYGRR